MKVIEHHQKVEPSNVFQTLIQSQQPVVDKSHFLHWLSDDSMNTVFISGEGWGSSTNLSMLYSFLSNQEPHLKELFKDLAISKQQAYQPFQGQYPVLWLDFSQIAWGSSEQEVKDYLLAAVKQLYVDFKQELPEDFSWQYLSESVQSLMKNLYKQLDIRPIILIDSYDKPIQIAYYGGFYDKINSKIERLLADCLKNTTYRRKAFLTGQARPGNKHISTHFNNFCLYSIFSRPVQGAFGFSQEDVKALFSAHKMLLSDESWQQLSFWYGGYYVKGKEYFNPRSINCYLHQLKQGNAEFKPFFTSDNPFLKNLPESIVGQLGELLNDKDKTIRLINDSYATYYLDSEKNEQVIFNRLLFNQFLTPTLATSDFMNYEAIELKLPNQEMVCFMKALLLNHYGRESALSKTQLMDFMKKYIKENPVDDDVLDLGPLIHQGHLFQASILVDRLKAKQIEGIPSESAKDLSSPSPATILSNNPLSSPIHSSRGNITLSEKEESGLISSV